MSNPQDWQTRAKSAEAHMEAQAKSWWTKYRLHTLVIGGILIAVVLGRCVLAAEPAHHKPEINLCTGGADGVYHFAGAQIALQAKNVLTVHVVETEGSLDNLERIEKGECNAAVVQSDAFLDYQRRHPTSALKLERSGVLYNELVHLLCNRKADISKISKLTPKHTVAVGRNGGGSAVTWDGFVAADAKTYKPVQTIPLGGERALAKVADGVDAQCLLFTAGLNSGFLKDKAMSYKDRIVLVPTDDRDIKDIKDAKGQRVYEYMSIPGGSYAGLLPGWNNNSSVDTIAVKAILAIDADWADALPKEYDKLLEALRKALPTIRQKVGQ